MTAIIAHRGASAYAPENTVAAFRLAAEMGANGIELDCRLSRDGAAVVIHDATVERTTNGRGAVGERTLAELKQLDAGSWKGPQFAGETIPALAEALQWAKDLGLTALLEIKSESGDEAPLDSPDRHEGDIRREETLAASLELIRIVIEESGRQGIADRVVLQSFAPEVCAWVRAFTPDLPVALLVDTRAAGALDTAAAWAARYNLAIHPSKDTLTEQGVRGLQAQGRRVRVWTLDEPEDIRRIAAWGVDGIISNRPDVCRLALGSTGCRSRTK